MSPQQYQDIIDKIKPELDKTIDFLKQEMNKLRTSRATPSLVEDIEVDCFGDTFVLKELASISCPQPRQILIQPWDKSYIQPIQKAISNSGLNLAPNVSGDTIRLNLPTLTEEHRKNMLRLLSEKSEEVFQTIRRWRREAWDKIQQGFKEGEITEDQKFKGKEKLQELIDNYNKKAKEITERKKKEIED